MAIEYKNAGVDVEAGYEAVKRMKEHVQRTMNERVVTDLGGFGGLFSLAGLNMEEPILVSGTDGVGTKVKLAFLMDKHDTVGIDAVAMCVNDVICCGASPLFFLDYIACGKNEPAKIAEIVKLPWALTIPYKKFRHTLEGVNIGFKKKEIMGFGAYSSVRGHTFGEWSMNSNLAQDWYLNEYATDNQVY